MTEHRLVLLVIGKLADQLDMAETEELENWVAESTDHERFMEIFNNWNLLTIELGRYERIDLDKGFAKVQALIDADRRSRLIRMASWSAACAALVVSGVLLFNGLPTHRMSATKTNNRSSNVPGAIKFVAKDPFAGYKVATTARHAQLALTLSDGSRVWLNDSTTLRYPENFSGSTRTVMLTGEAYFEIANAASRPFVVRLDGASVEARGTSFDCSSYPGEAAKITLLKGAINVSTANDSAILTPNQQAIVSANGTLNLQKNVSAASIAGWKDGHIYFIQTPLDQLIRELARCYDVQVVDATGLTGVLYDGTVDRSLPLDSLLRTLDNTQLKFQLKNRKLIILAR